MPYTKTDWKDQISEYPNRYVQVVNGDGTVTLTKSEGNVVQAGTVLSATNLNKAEQGIADAHAQLDGAARQTQTLVHGLSVLNGGVDSPVNIQIEGRTLIPMQNTVLDPLKLYLLADKKKKLKWADASLTTGVAKFTGKAERPTIIHTSNFENKVSGSTLENPHITKHNVASTSLVVPSSFSTESSTAIYSDLQSLNGAMNILSATGSGIISQRLFSFDLIQAVERTIGRIPRNTTAEKVQWLKDNIKQLTGNWQGYGSSVGGNKASIATWKVDTTTWVGAATHTLGSVQKLSQVLQASTSNLVDKIDANGFVHFLAYADASDGVTASTINTDYVELEIELQPTAILHNPRVPLYEVTQAHYDAILVTWLEEEVLRRYPAAEGVQHVQNPYVMAEGENLLPPFSEWVLHANAKMNSAYDLSHVAVAANEVNSVFVKAMPNTQYTLKLDTSAVSRVSIASRFGGAITTTHYDSSNYDDNVVTFTTDSKAEEIAVYLYSKAAGTFNYTNPTLNLGTATKPFVPKNPSYLLAEMKLGALNGVYDRLYEQDGKYMVRKAIEKDVVLDGALTWLFNSDAVGFKRLEVATQTPMLADGAGVVSKYNGLSLGKILVTSLNMTTGDLYRFGTNVVVSASDTDTGFGEHYKPSVAEMQAYFNGWKATGFTAGTNITAEATGSLATNATFTFVQGNTYRNVVVTKSTDNVTFTPAVEGTDYTIDISGTKAVIKNINVATLYLKIDYNYGATVNTWQSIVDGSVSPTQTSAYVSNVANKLAIYTPYKLSYQLATPVVSEARTEGAISVNGLTQVEVGSGVIVREKVTPLLYTSSYYGINIKDGTYGLNNNQLKNKLSKFISVYKNGVSDKTWVIAADASAYGMARATNSPGNFDATAEYTVSYIMYDKQPFTANIVNLLAQYANTIRTALDDTVKKVEDNQTAIAVNTNLIYDILKRLKAGGI